MALSTPQKADKLISANLAIKEKTIVEQESKEKMRQGLRKKWTSLSVLLLMC